MKLSFKSTILDQKQQQHENYKTSSKKQEPLLGHSNISGVSDTLYAIFYLQVWLCSTVGCASFKGPSLVRGFELHPIMRWQAKILAAPSEVEIRALFGNIYRSGKINELSNYWPFLLLVRDTSLAINDTLKKLNENDWKPGRGRREKKTDTIVKKKLDDP